MKWNLRERLADLRAGLLSVLRRHPLELALLLALSVTLIVSLETDREPNGPRLLVMGSEDTGISKEVLKLCDEQLAIPMIGHVESLNVSAAAAVMLFEVVRQRIGE